MIGYLWANMDRRSNWNQMIKQMQEVAPRLFAAVHPDGIEHPDGGKQTTQTITAFSLPDEAAPEGPAASDPRGSRFGVPAVAHGTDGVRITAVWENYPGTQVVEVATGKRLILEPGDIILEINGRPLRSLQNYIDCVKNSPQTMEFVIRNVRNGERVPLRVQLRN
jgi:S1-C subfamily serine protease